MIKKVLIGILLLVVIVLSISIQARVELNDIANFIFTGKILRVLTKK